MDSSVDQFVRPLGTPSDVRRALADRMDLSTPAVGLLTGEDSLRLTTVGNAAGLTITAIARVFGFDGVLRATPITQAPNSNRTTKQTLAALGEGWLLDVTVSVTGGTLIGNQLWCLVELVRGLTGATAVVTSLVEGFPTANVPIFWPAGVVAGPLDGSGHLRSITGTTPAAGAEISETCPTGARWDLLVFFAQFVTSAAAANRFPTLTLDDGANVYYRLGSGANQTATVTFRREWMPGIGLPNADNANDQAVGLPTMISIGPGHRIKTVTTAIDVADQWSLVQYLVKERFDV